MKKYIILYVPNEIECKELYYYDGDNISVENALIIDNLATASRFIIKADKLLGQNKNVRHPYFKWCEIREVII